MASTITFSSRVETAARTDVGCVRQVNEDAFIANPNERLWAVADGMGGHQVGDVASNFIISELEGVRFAKSLAEATVEVEKALQRSNDNITCYAREHFGSATMGSTACVLLLGEHAGSTIWVGDSRLYRMRENQLERLTRDHSQVQEMLDMGVLSETEARDHPHANVITRAVGVEDELFPETSIFSVLPGDEFLLCSDGLYGMLEDSDILHALKNRSVEEAVALMMEQALDRGANDNVTILAVAVANDEYRTELPQSV